MACVLSSVLVCVELYGLPFVKGCPQLRIVPCSASQFSMHSLNHWQQSCSQHQLCHRAKHRTQVRAHNIGFQQVSHLSVSSLRTTSEHAVIIKDAHLAFGTELDIRPVLKGVNLNIKRGSLHMLLGPNGCGKSTLLKVLGGLINLTSGTIITDQPTGFVFQNPDHQVVMPTVAADVAFGLGRYTLPEQDVKQAVCSALELVSMQGTINRATHTLSGGQRQRIAIAGALAENPRLLLLDELTTFLDVEDQFGVLEAVRAITRRGCVTSVAADLASGGSSSGLSSGDEPETQLSTQTQARTGPSSSNGDSIQAGGSSDVTASITARSQEHVTAIWVTHRFEELQYADSASYMSDGRVVFTGTGPEMVQYLKSLGAPV